MLFLDKFWRGNIVPGEGRYLPRKEYTNAIQRMEQCDDSLRSHLSPEDYQVFLEYAEAALAATSTESCDNFIEGFRFGVRLMIDVLVDSDR